MQMLCLLALKYVTWWARLSALLTAIISCLDQAQSAWDQKCTIYLKFCVQVENIQVLLNKKLGLDGSAEVARNRSLPQALWGHTHIGTYVPKSKNIKIGEFLYIAKGSARDVPQPGVADRINIPVRGVRGDSTNIQAVVRNRYRLDRPAVGRN